MENNDDKIDHTKTKKHRDFVNQTVFITPKDAKSFQLYMDKKNDLAFQSTMIFKNDLKMICKRGYILM